MSAWGLSRAGREAKGFPREFGAWNFQQYKDWLDRMKQFEQQAGPLRQQAVAYWQNRMSQGAPSVEQSAETGRRILPGLEEASARQWRRLHDIAQDWTRTAGELEGDWQLGVDRSRAYYQNLANLINEQFGDITGNIQRTFAPVLERTGKAYDEALAALEQIRPGSEAAAARAARAFAPAEAAMAARLRRAGLDPNSPAAAAALRQVDVSRARAIDDALAEGAERYAVRRGALGIQRAGELGQLERERGALEREATRERGGLFRDLEREDLERVLRQLGERSDLRRESFANVSRILGELNEQERRDLQNALLRFQLGQEEERYRLSDQDRAAAQILGISEADYRRMLAAADAARGFGQDALKSYLASLGIESQNAGWLAKLLAGAGVNLLGAVI